MTDDGGANRTPAYKKDSFDCPHCGAFAGMWFRKFLVWDDVNQEANSIHLAGAECFACKQWSVWRWTAPDEDPLAAGIERGQLLWPTARLSAPTPSADMPEAVRALYTEAASVGQASPRSAAALLRLALESMLKALYPAEHNLNAMIGAATRDGLSPAVSRAMDVLRFNGNEAVHELHREDTAEIVAALFDLLNLVVGQLVSQPRRIEEMYQAMPEKVRESIEMRNQT